MSEGKILEFSQESESHKNKVLGNILALKESLPSIQKKIEIIAKVAKEQYPVTRFHLTDGQIAFYGKLGREELITELEEASLEDLQLGDGVEEYFKILIFLSSHNESTPKQEIPGKVLPLNRNREK